MGSGPDGIDHCPKTHSECSDPFGIDDFARGNVIQNLIQPADRALDITGDLLNAVSLCIIKEGTFDYRGRNAVSRKKPGQIAFQKQIIEKDDSSQEGSDDHKRKTGGSVR